MLNAGLEFLRGTHFKATAEGHLRPLYTKEYHRKYRASRPSQRAPETMASDGLWIIRALAKWIVKRFVLGHSSQRIPVLCSAAMWISQGAIHYLKSPKCTYIPCTYAHECIGMLECVTLKSAILSY